MVVPAGLEEFFLALGKPIDKIEFLPPPAMDAETMKWVKEVAEKYGQTLYPPDYLG